MMRRTWNRPLPGPGHGNCRVKSAVAACDNHCGVDLCLTRAAGDQVEYRSLAPARSRLSWAGSRRRAWPAARWPGRARHRRALSRPVIVLGAVTGTPRRPKTARIARRLVRSSSGTPAASANTTSTSSAASPASARALHGPAQRGRPARSRPRVEGCGVAGQLGRRCAARRGHGLGRVLNDQHRAALPRHVAAGAGSRTAGRPGPGRRFR